MPLSREKLPLPLSVSWLTLLELVVVLLSEILPVEVLAMVRGSAVEEVPMAPPADSEMPPEPEERVTPEPEAETTAPIVEAAAPVAVKEVVPVEVRLLEMAKEEPVRERLPLTDSEVVGLVMLPALVTVKLLILVKEPIARSVEPLFKVTL